MCEIIKFHGNTDMFSGDGEEAQNNDEIPELVTPSVLNNTSVHYSAIPFAIQITDSLNKLIQINYVPLKIGRFDLSGPD